MTAGARDIQLREGPDVDLERLTVLREAAGWPPYSLDVLSGQVRGSRWVVSAWDEGRMVGFIRGISDGVSNGYICTFVVDEAYRGRGIGRALMERLLERETVRWVLHAQPTAAGFYEKLGFSPAAEMWWRDRRRAP